MGRRKATQETAPDTTNITTSSEVVKTDETTEVVATPPKEEGLQEVTLLKTVVVDDVAFPPGHKLKVTPEGKKGLVSIGAVKG